MRIGFGCYVAVYGSTEPADAEWPIVYDYLPILLWGDPVGSNEGSASDAIIDK